MGKSARFVGSPAARYPENRMSTGQKGPERGGLRKVGGGLGESGWPERAAPGQ
jgi:hypothetical protein